MTKRFYLTIACGLLLGSATAANAQTVVNFDDLIGSDDLPTGYGGINWSPDWTYYSFAQDPYNPSSPNTRIYTYNQNWFTFDSPTTFNGAYFAGPATTVSFSLYLNSALVATSGELTDSDVPTFLSSGYTGMVDRVEVNGPTGFYIMDDVSYGGSGNTVTPEPVSMTLLGTGLAGIAAARRRRKQQSETV